MAPIEFNSGDEPFMDWRVSNPDGYILNASPGGNSRYLRLHLASCSQIPLETKNAGGFTTREYIKVCSNDVDSLKDWASVNRPGEIKYCKTCFPHVSSIAEPLAEEISSANTYPEGTFRIVQINSYERNPQARTACLSHYGHTCQICGFDFEKVFGEFAKGFIHVHHVIPLHTIGSKYKVDPIKDLVPVCPNCHAAIHHGGALRTVDEIKKILERA